MVATYSCLQHCGAGADSDKDSLGSSYDSDEQATILPSIEEIFGNRIKDEPVQNFHTLRSSSSPTASSDQNGPTPDTSPIARACSIPSTFSNLSCSTSTDLYGQLKASIQPVDDQDIAEFPQSPSNLAELDSERTDSEFATSSPCPNQDLACRLPDIPLASHYSDINLVNNTKPVQRKLDFNMVTFRSTIDDVSQALDSCGIT